MVGDGSGGRVIGSTSEPLPPAVTQRNHRGATSPDLVLAPPFVPGRNAHEETAETVAPTGDTPTLANSSTDQVAPAAGPLNDQVAPVADLLNDELSPVAGPLNDELSPVADLLNDQVSPGAELPGSEGGPFAAEPVLELTDPFVADPDALPEPMPWEAPSVEPLPWEAIPETPDWARAKADDEAEGVVQPAFAEDVSVTTDAILAATPEQEFPIDAFIIPEHAKRVPTGVPDPEHAHHGDPTSELADRFEKLSRRLRAEDIESLLPHLARGDRFDALVAGFIAGYFSARDI